MLITEIFSRVISMSIAASIVIAAVIILRFLLRRVPKINSYILWTAVLLRLLCPFALVLPVGLAPVEISDIDTAQETVREMPVPETENAVSPMPSSDNIYMHFPDTTDENIVPADRAADFPTEEFYTYPQTALPREIVPTETVLPESEQPEEKNFTFTPFFVISLIWCAGAAVMALRGIISLVRLNSRLKGAVRLSGRIYASDSVDNGFIMGIIRPKIYIPAAVPHSRRKYILLHERTHLMRGDNVIKLLMYIALCIHWINPLVWIAFSLCEQDMEMSCDEAVTAKMSVKERADYSQTLLDISAQKAALFTACFGESGIKGRIKNVLSFRKPALWISLICGCAVICATILLSANKRVNIFEAENISLDGGVSISGSSIADEDISRIADVMEHIYVDRKREKIDIDLTDCIRIETKDKGLAVFGDDTGSYFGAYAMNDKNDLRMYRISESDLDKIIIAAKSVVNNDNSIGKIGISSHDILNKEQFTDSRNLPFYINGTAAEQPGGECMDKFVNAIIDMDKVSCEQEGSVITDNIFSMSFAVNESLHDEYGIQMYIITTDADKYYIQMNTDPDIYFFELAKKEYDKLISLGEAAVEETNNTDPAVNAFLKSDYGSAKTVYGGRDVIFRDDEVRTLLDTLVKTRHVRYAGSISEELDKESIVSREVSLYPDEAMSEAGKTVFSVNRGKAADGYERYFISLISSNSAYECYITQEEYIDFVNAVSEKAVGYPAHYLYRSSPGISGLEHSIYLDREDGSRCTAAEIDDDTAAVAVPWGDKNILYIYSISQQKIIYQAAFSRYEFSGSCMILTDINHHTDSPDPDKFGMYSDDTIGRKFFLLTRNDNMYAAEFDPVSCSMLFSVYGEDTYYTVESDRLIGEDEAGIGTGSITKDGKRIYLDITDDIPALCNLEIVIEDSGAEKRYRLFGTERFDNKKAININNL